MIQFINLFSSFPFMKGNLKRPKLSKARSYGDEMVNIFFQRQLLVTRKWPDACLTTSLVIR